MPPKKRTAAEANKGSEAAGSKSKRQSVDKQQDSESNDPKTTEEPQSEDDEGASLDAGDPYEYISFPQPFYDFKHECQNRDKGDDGDDDDDNGDKDAVDDDHDEDWEDDDDDEDAIVDKYNAMLKNTKKKLVLFTEKEPGHKWFSMRDTIKQKSDIRIRADYTCPDLFNMYIYNDFHGYGLQEVIENSLVAFNKEFNKKDRSDATLKQMWSNIASLVHWLTEGNIMPWIGCDDGERVKTTCDLIGKALLTALNELDRAGYLKADSDFKDIGLVISLILSFAEDLPQYGIDEIEWQESFVAYSKKANIDLTAVGCSGIVTTIEEIEGGDEIEALEGAAKADRWGWKKEFKSFKDCYGKVGGEKYNIMKFSRKERASHAFDKKDPLAKFSDAEINSGNLMVM